MDLEADAREWRWHGSEAHGSEAHGSEAHGSEAHGSERHGSEAHGSGWRKSGWLGLWWFSLAVGLSLVPPVQDFLWDSAIPHARAALSGRPLASMQQTQVRALLVALQQHELEAQATLVNPLNLAQRSTLERRLERLRLQMAQARQELLWKGLGQRPVQLGGVGFMLLVGAWTGFQLYFKRNPGRGPRSWGRTEEAAASLRRWEQGVDQPPSELRRSEARRSEPRPPIGAAPASRLDLSEQAARMGQPPADSLPSGDRQTGPQRVLAGDPAERSLYIAPLDPALTGEDVQESLPRVDAEGLPVSLHLPEFDVERLAAALEAVPMIGWGRLHHVMRNRSPVPLDEVERALDGWTASDGLDELGLLTFLAHQLALHEAQEVRLEARSGSVQLLWQGQQGQMLPTGRLAGLRFPSMVAILSSVLELGPRPIRWIMPSAAGYQVQELSLDESGLRLRALGA